MIDFSVNVIWFSKEKYRIDAALWPHKHDYYHYIYILNGTGKITIDGNDYLAQENDFYLTHKGITHSLETKSKDGMTVIEIKFEVNNEQLASHLNRLPYRVRLPGLDIRHKLENFIYEGMRKEAYHEELINLQFTEILLFLLRYNENSTKSISSSLISTSSRNNMDASRDAIDTKCLDDAINYMKNNLTMVFVWIICPRLPKCQSIIFAGVSKNITVQPRCNIL